MPREPFREQDAEEQIVDLYRRLDWVEAGMVRAEDGSLVPASFYDPPPGPEPKTLIASKPSLRHNANATSRSSSRRSSGALVTRATEPRPL